MAPNGPLRARGLLLALLVASAVVAGCGAKTATEAGLDDALSDELVEVAPGLVVASNRGAIAGSVRDESNLSIAGARVSLAGEDAFMDSERDGAFRFLNLTAGPHTILVHTESYQPAEVPVDVVAGQVTNVTVNLLPIEDRGAGYIPHLHDYWGDETEIVIIDDDVQLAPTPNDRATALTFIGSQTAANNNQSWVLPMVGAVTDRPIVYPGTREVAVTLSWNSQQVTLPRIGLGYASAFSAARTNLAAKPSGQTWNIPTNESMADSGHQKFSLWTFWAYSANAYGQAPNYQPAAALGAIHVKIVIKKGGVALEPSHEDYWADGDVLVLRDPARPTMEIGLNPTRTTSTGPPNLLLDAGKIVPPGTKKLRIDFRIVYTQQQGTNTYDYDLTWRTGSQNPHTTRIQDFSRATPTVNQPDHKVWELDLRPEDTDAFYQRKSNWVFSPWPKPWPEDATYLETRGRNFYLGVVAEKDPSFRDA